MKCGKGVLRQSSRFIIPLVVCAVFATMAFAAPVDSEAWRIDLAHLASELPARHANAFFQTNEEEFLAAVAALDRDIPSLEQHQIIVRLLRLVAMVGDAHTTLSGYSFEYFPIRVYRFSDGFFVTRATKEHEDLVGARLTGIDGKEIEDVAALVSTVIPHENQWWLRSRLPSFIIAAEVLHGVGVTRDRQLARFTFATEGGELLERELTPLEAGSAASWIERPDRSSALLPLYLQTQNLNYWYEYLPGQRILYLKYNVCRDIPGKPFNQVGEEVAAILATQPVDTLVLDMRNNSGGNSSVLQPLITGIQMMPQYNQADRLFVIVGRATFSSAVLNSIQLRQQTNATFLGEPTGGKPNSYGELLSFVLPGSGLRVGYSTKYFEMLPGEDPSSFEPDVRIEISSDEYFLMRDPVLESIFQQLPRRRSVTRRR